MSNVFFKQTIVAPVQRYRVIPDLCRNVDGAVRVSEPFAPEKLEMKGLTHQCMIVFRRTY